MYALASYLTGFYILGLPLPGETSLERWMHDSMFIWGTSCLAIVVMRLALADRRKRGPGAITFHWAVTTVPFILGCALSITDFIRRMELGSFSAIPGDYVWVAVSWAFVLLPVAIGAILTVAIRVVDRRLSRFAPPGHCSTCGYNLTGNVSGVCPECGTSVQATEKPQNH
jgi:hypothetical protein